MSTLRVGVLGAGRIGSVHAHTLASCVPGAEVVAVADPVAARAASLAQQVGAARASSAWRDVLDAADVDAVCVCSSTDTHAELVIAAAAAGKHVFCEKPLDLRLERIDEVIEAVRRAGVKLQVGFNRRFDPDFAELRRLVAAGSLGTVELLRITSRDPEPPPPAYVGVSGGLFLDMTIHDFDMARFLLGREVTEVYAAAAVRCDPAIGEAGDVDTAIVTLRFDDATLAVIENSRRAVYGYDQRVEVFGSGGRAANANWRPHTVHTADASGEHAAPLLSFFMQRYQQAYEAELQAFVACVQRDLPAPVGGHDGRQAVLIAQAAQRSLDLGRPVRLT